ncbi:5-methylcytosine restriction system specificity protein McrC [Bacillus sp. m3-13]|uniref:5-methylcytosine restriction system specificity protein McrC n=1 Tax=Bacillus sp. m3-13 TaxID=406124 RepID=UPI0001E89C41|nr:restriction endonuclease [Bacillus sp. m3-13]
MISSENHSRIPIKNIYYMLAYAWNHPQEKDFISVFGEDENDLVNLLSKVLLIKVKALIKKGFYKEYIQTTDESGIIRGKILFKESMETFSYRRGKLHILEDEMTHDILHNQIIKTTLYHLSKLDQLERGCKEEITKILPYFSDVSLIKVSSRLFNEIKLHRNNQHYQFLLDISQFIWENSLLHEGQAEQQFQDYSREHRKLAKLFEDFVKNFYRKEIRGSKAKSESLYWPAEGEETTLLPKMTTDISLEYDNKKFIIDTKFYKDIFSEQWEKETVRSAHLYQLFAYLKNEEYFSGRKAGGVLLYPEVHKKVDLKYRMHGFDVRVCTVDLNGEWQGIHERLLEVVGK